MRHRDSAHDRRHAAGVQNPRHGYDIAQSFRLPETGVMHIAAALALDL